jgi:hypothetical protein
MCCGSPRRVLEWGCALGYAILSFRLRNVVGVVGGHRDVLGSGGGLWDTPASRLHMRDVIGVVGGHQDVLESGGGLWDTPASRLYMRDVIGVVVGH